MDQAIEHVEASASEEGRLSELDLCRVPVHAGGVARSIYMFWLGT